MVAMVIDTFGVRLTANAADMRGQIRAGKFFWLDIFGGDNLERTALLRELGLEGADITWAALRFGQAGRMYIGRDRLRAVTPDCRPVRQRSRGPRLRRLDLYSGRSGSETAARSTKFAKQFGERVGSLDDSRYAAAGILLQLLIGTLDWRRPGLDSAPGRVTWARPRQGSDDRLYCI